MDAFCFSWSAAIFGVSGMAGQVKEAPARWWCVIPSEWRMRHSFEVCSPYSENSYKCYRPHDCCPLSFVKFSVSTAGKILFSDQQKRKLKYISKTKKEKETQKQEKSSARQIYVYFSVRPFNSTNFLLYIFLLGKHL